MRFKCDKCGLCCKCISLNPIFVALDRGDGVCKYLKDNLCSIYEERPLICRIDDCYNAYFEKQYTIEEFYSMNEEICSQLKNRYEVSVNPK